MENRENRESRFDEASHESFVSESMQPSFGIVGRGGTLEDPLGPARNVARRWRLLAVLVVVGSLLGWVSAIVAADSAIAPVAVDHFEAKHVLVIDNAVPSTQSVLGVRNLNVLARRVTIGEVPVAVASALDIDQSVASTQVRAIIRSDSETLDIVAVAPTPGQAEMLADEFARQLLSYLEAEAREFAAETVASAELRLSEAEANLASVRTELAAAEAAEDIEATTLLSQDEQQFLSARIHANAELLDARSTGIPVVPIETLQGAAGNASVISQSRFDQVVDNAALGQNIAILFGSDSEVAEDSGALSAVSNSLPSGVIPRIGFGALLGLLGGVLVSIVLNRLDTRVRSKRQVEELLDLPVLAEVPSLERSQRDDGEIVARSAPRSRFAEQYRALGSALSYARRARQQSGQVVLVTSPGPSEGKTTTVANLGAMVAEAGQSVLLINCDFRRPRLHHMTKTAYQPETVSPTNIEGLSLISNAISIEDALPTEIIAAQRTVIEKAKDIYDVVIIDTAPLLATNDAVDLLDLADDVVLVIRAGQTTLQGADRAAEILERRRAHVLGIAISDVSARHSTGLYYDGYYGDEYYDDDSDSESRRGAAQPLDVRDRVARRATVGPQGSSPTGASGQVAVSELALEVADSADDVDALETSKEVDLDDFDLSKFTLESFDLEALDLVDLIPRVDLGSDLNVDLNADLDGARQPGDQRGNAAGVIDGRDASTDARPPRAT